MRTFFYILILFFLTSSPPAALEVVFPDSGWTLKRQEGSARFLKAPRPMVALVLSGGGSRGFAHVGAITALEQAGIEPDLVVGTSMGGVVGGLYASGLEPAELERLATTLDWDRLFSDNPSRQDQFITQKQDEGNHILQFRLSGGRVSLPTALISGQYIMNFLTGKTLGADYTAGFDFDSLPRRFRAVATDLTSAERVVLSRGSLAEALRATLAVPFIFTPFPRDGRLLVDGGFTNVLPADVAIGLGARVVIAVHVRPVLYNQDELGNPVHFIDQIVSICLTNQDRRPERDSVVMVVPALGRHMPDRFENIPALIQAGADGIRARLPEIRARLGEGVGSPDTFYLQSVRIEGLQNLPSARFYARFDSLLEKRVSFDVLRDAARELYSTGFFDTVRAEFRPVAAGTSLIIRVREHPPIRELKVEGNTLFSGTRIRELFGCRAGWPVSPVEIRKGTEAVRAAYRDSGFILSRVRAAADSTGGFRILVDEGVVRKIEIRGNRVTRDDIIRREVSLSRNEPFSIRRMECDVRNLYATGLFENVHVTLDEAAGPLTVVLNVDEKASEAFRLGVRYDNIRMLEGYLGLRSINLGGRGYSLNSILHYGLRREKYLLGLRTDRLFHTFVTAETRGFYYRDRKYIPDPLDTTRFMFNALSKFGFSASVAHQILRMGKVSYVFMIEHYKSSKDETDIGPLTGYEKGLRIASLRAEFDTRDNPDYPRSGVSVFNSLDFGLDVLGRHNAFFEYTVTASAALTKAGRHTFLPTAYLCMADVPLPEPVRNYLGGATELRMNDDLVFFNSFPLFGYAEQAFTGEYLAALRLAYRYQLLQNHYFFFLANLGRVWNGVDFQWERLFDQLAQDAYSGVAFIYSYRIPQVGPAALTFALPVGKRDEKVSEDPVKLIYFSVGHNF